MEECGVCFEIDILCQFHCQHKMCLECFIKFSENHHSCHICRKNIDYDNIKFNGDETLYYRQLNGQIKSLKSMNLEKMTCLQLYRIIELKMFGNYVDDLRIINSIRQLPRDDIKVAEVKPVIIDQSIIHCVLRLRAD